MVLLKLSPDKDSSPERRCKTVENFVILFGGNKEPVTVINLPLN